MSVHFDPTVFRLVFPQAFYFIFTASFIPFILHPNAAIGVWILIFLFLYACVRHAMDDEHPKEVARSTRKSPMAGRAFNAGTLGMIR